MSMTLILWKAPVVDDEDEAQALLEPWYETGDDSAFEPSEDLAAVHDLLLRDFPLDPQDGAIRSGDDRSGLAPPGCRAIPLRDGPEWSALDAWQTRSR